jgi:hypothetical protein
MAIDKTKLPPTFTVDFIILINQFGKYIQSVVEKTAGTRPNSIGVNDRGYRGTITTVTLSLNAAGNAANTGLISFWRTYIVPLDSKASVDGVGTFDKTYKDIATWNNYFFVLRTQLLGAVGGNSNDPIIKEMDAVWSNILLISGKWVVISKRGPKN